MTALPQSRRYRFALAARNRMLFLDGKLRLTPVVRFDALYNDVAGTTSGGDVLHNAYHDFFSPRFGVRYRLFDGFSLKGNVGRYFRAPSLLELFGNRGTAVGNPELVPESGWSGDLGAELKLKKQIWRLQKLYLQAVFFGRKSKNLIQWVQNSQRTAVAANVQKARALGLESAAGAWFAFRPRIDVHLQVNHTLLWTENLAAAPLLEGNRLAGRPLHEVNARLEVSWRYKKLRLAAHTALHHISKSFLDEANLFLPVPTRTLVEAGLKISPWLRALTVAVTFKNIADVRVEHVSAPAFSGLSTLPRPLADYGGYPLPGWSFFITALWKK
jgi:iron complex outermembrane receptor protein